MSVVYFVFFTLILCQCTSCFGDQNAHSGKTFLLPQSLRSPSERTFYDHIRGLFVKKKKMHGGGVRIESFRHCDQNRKDIGTYFGRGDGNVVSIGNEKTDFQATNLVFSNNPSAVTLKGKVELSPYRRIRGLYFCCFKRLTKLSKKLFVGVSVPWFHITRKMGVKISDEEKETVEGKKRGIWDYFSGNLHQAGKPHIQEPLKYAKLTSTGSNYKEGLSDSEIFLSYQWGKNSYYFDFYQRHYFRSSVGLIVPTSNRTKGEFLFEPLLGNGKRWGIKTSFESMSVLYKSFETEIRTILGCNIQYLFGNRQKRMVSFRSDDHDSYRSWAHFYGLLGEQGKRGVFPAANVLMRDVKVSRGNSFDCFLACMLLHKNFALSLGYNFFARGAEVVGVKEWEDNKYALASPAYDTSTNFNIVSDPNPAVDDNVEGPIQKNMLDTSVARTPAVSTHKVYGMVSSVWDKLQVPLSVGVGASYEFVSDNAALEGYELFLKVGAAF